MTRARCNVNIWGRRWTACLLRQRGIRHALTNKIADGYCDGNQAIIFICPVKQTQEHLRLTIAHEVVHATWHGVFFDEAGCDRVADNIVNGLDTPFANLNKRLRRAYRQVCRKLLGEKR